MRPIDKFILHVIHNWENGLNEAYAPSIMTKLMDKFKEEADDLNVNITDEQLKKYIERFDVLKTSPKIIEKDLFKYSLSQLIKLASSSAGAELPDEINITPDVVYHNDDNTVVVWNGNKDGNCMSYGNGEKWCITRGSWAGHRYDSGKKFPTFYLAKNNNLSDSDPLSFVVIQVRDTQYNGDKYVLHNRTNSPHYPDPISYNELLSQAPWLAEIPNLQGILKYQPLSTQETINNKYKNNAISIREWTNLPFETKKQYLVARSGRNDLFDDIPLTTFINQHLPKYPQLAQFIAVTPDIIDPIMLLKNLESFNNQDRKSITANIQDPIRLKYLNTDTLPFDVKKLLVILNKWDINNNQRIYITKDGKAIVLLDLKDDINIGVYTAEDDYPNIKLNQRTSKYLLDYPELDKIPFNTLLDLASKNIIDKNTLDQILEKAKNDPESTIIAKDTENGTIVIDGNSLTAYRLQDGNVSKLPFDDEEVQAVFNEKDDNQGFQQGLMNNLFRTRQDIPNSIDRESLISIINSTSYPDRTFPTTYSDTPLVILTTDGDNPKIFTAYDSIQNVSGNDIPFIRSNWGAYSDWRTVQQNNSSMTEKELDSYLNYLQNQNQAFTDSQLLDMMKINPYSLSGDRKKFILTNSNLPLDPSNIYVPVENDGTVYLINTQNPSSSAKISNDSGKLIKANITANASRRLLGNQAARVEPELEPGATTQPETPATQDGAPRRGRPAGVPNAPRQPQQRAQGDVNVGEAFAERGLLNGFRNLPRNDQRRLNVEDAVALNRIGDRGASARDNLLAGQGQVTNVVSVGPSKIYFIRLNNDDQDRIASINIQPGNRNYVVVGGNSYSLNSPRELVGFLQNRNLLEILRTSMFKLHLQENPHMIEKMKNLKENISQEAAIIHAMLQTGQQSAQDFIDYNNVDARKLIDYIKQYKGESRESIIRDVITGNVRDYNPQSLKAFKSMFLKKIKNKSMKMSEFKSLVREAIKKKLAENQSAPARETPGRETETIPDKGTEEKKRRHIGNPDKMPEKTPAKATSTMNENEQEIIKQIVARFKSKK